MDADSARQYDFHSDRLEKQHNHRRERWRSNNLKQWVLIVIVIVLLFGTLAFLFFGNSEQQQNARHIILHLLTLIVGFGSGYLIRFLGKKNAHV